MRMAFFVNGVETEKAVYTTTRLAREACRRGHEVWYVGAEDITTLPDASARGQRSTGSGWGTLLQQEVSGGCTEVGA